MDDFPPREPPRFWIAFGILCAAFALSVVMSVVLTVDAHAQARCGPLEAVIEGLGVAQEKVVWEGVMPTEQGPIEALLFQSPKGTWTMVAVSGTTACFMAAGQDGTPINDSGV